MSARRYHADDPRPRLLRALADAVERGEAVTAQCDVSHEWHRWDGGYARVKLEVRSLTDAAAADIVAAARPRYPDDDALAQWHALGYAL